MALRWMEWHTVKEAEKLGTLRRLRQCFAE